MAKSNAKKKSAKESAKSSESKSGGNGGVEGETNVFANPEGALEEGSATQLAVLDGNQVVEPESDEIEDRETATAVLSQIDELIVDIDRKYWSLSAKLAEVANRRYYRVLEFKTFEEYLDSKCGIKRRKGYYLVQIHNYFNSELKSLLADDQETYQYVLDAARSIGWTKAMKLASERIITKENAREVVDKIKDCSVRDMDVWCKTYFDSLPEEAQQDAIDDNSIKTVRLSFQCTLPQKEDVDEAVKTATSMMSDGASKSSALSMVCRDFLSTHITAKGGKLLLAEELSKFERFFGLALVAIDEKAGTIVYGEDNLKRLAKDEGEHVSDIPSVDVSAEVTQSAVQ